MKTRQSMRRVMALAFLVGAALHPAQAAPAAPASETSPLSTGELTRLKQFLDKNGGYREKSGGYYDPTAGTYTDIKGGVVDNWQGYTYADGSYKSAAGDYFDAPKNMISLASGDSFKAEGMTPADIIHVLRENVQENGGYNKDFIRNGMMDQIRKEHPPGK